MEDRGSPSSVGLIGGRLEVAGGSVDEPDHPAGASILEEPFDEAELTRNSLWPVSSRRE
jgi:hypothetical protein